MASLKSSETTRQFDASILDRVERLRHAPCCNWCKDPQYVIHNKSTGLCSSCYRWYKMHEKLTEEVRQLPPEGQKDPHLQKRLELDVAKEAIELCKGDGNVRDRRLDHVKRSISSICLPV